MDLQESTTAEGTKVPYNPKPEQINIYVGH